MSPLDVFILVVVICILGLLAFICKPVAMVDKEGDDWTKLVVSTSISLYAKRLALRGINYKINGNSLHVMAKDFQKAQRLLKSV